MSCLAVPAALGTLGNVILHKGRDSSARMWETITPRCLLQSQGVLQERYSVLFVEWRGVLQMTHFLILRC